MEGGCRIEPANKAGGQASKVIWHEGRDGDDHQCQNLTQADFTECLGDFDKQGLSAKTVHFGINGAMQQNECKGANAKPFMQDINPFEAAENYFKHAEAGRQQLGNSHHNKRCLAKILAQQRDWIMLACKGGKPQNWLSQSRCDLSKT